MQRYDKEHKGSRNDKQIGHYVIDRSKEQRSAVPGELNKKKNTHYGRHTCMYTLARSSWQNTERSSHALLHFNIRLHINLFITLAHVLYCLVCIVILQ